MARTKRGSSTGLALDGSKLFLTGSTRQAEFIVALPSALAYVFVGLKQSIPYALMAAVVGEILAYQRRGTVCIGICNLNVEMA